MEPRKNKSTILRRLSKFTNCGPLPDPYGYEYKDTSMNANKRASLLKSNRLSEASLILKECGKETKQTIQEKFMDSILKVIGAGFVNIIRGKLLSLFDIDIDKDSFHKISELEVTDSKPENLKSPEKVYVSLVQKDDKRCVVIMNKGKIIEVYGDKLVSPNSNCKSVLNRADTTWWVKTASAKNEMFNISPAQKLLINFD